VGGAALGLGLGYVAYRMLKSVDNYQVEILISLGLVTGGYALADRLHTSGPIAMVVAGLLIGNHGRAFAMSATTREHLDLFWELIDEILNAVLFVLIGLEVLVVTVTHKAFIAGLVAVAVVLLARWISVAFPVAALKKYKTFDPHSVKILTWSGLRGGISVAMALSLKNALPASSGNAHELILVMTYVVVLCSILLQGLTIGPLIRRWYRNAPATPAGSGH
jgi:CPA1 family monovalent cation:H+ antiporter